MNTDAVIEQLANSRETGIGRLTDLLRIQSVSTDPAFASHIEHGAAWVDEQLREIGLDSAIHETAGHPAVIARTRPEQAPPDAPRVLFYGHYDVQPADPIDLWDTPPFEPTVRDGAIVARGASDDKGQVCCFLEALRAWMTAHGKLPVHVTVLIEGEEEMGSVNLPPFLEQHRDLLQADVALVSDTTMWDTPNGPRPAIIFGLRGLLYFDVQLHGPSRDLHSGVYGAAVPNPATILTRVLGGLFDESNAVTIPGFYDDVIVLTDEQRAAWRNVPFDESQFLGAIGLEQGHGEDGYSTIERRWARPSCDVNGLYGGYGGAGAKTIIPSFAGAKVSFRLASNQDPDKIAVVFTDWLKSHDVAGLEWRITEHGRARPVIVSTDSPHIAAARRAIEQASGQQPLLVREGATIPVIADFQSTLGLDTLLIGFGLSNDRIHAPNEKFDLSCFDLGCRTHALLLAELAK